MIVWNNEEGVVRLCFDGNMLIPTIKTEDDLILGFFAWSSAVFSPVGGTESWDNMPLTADGRLRVLPMSKQPKQVQRVTDCIGWQLERITLSLGLGEDPDGNPVVCVLNSEGTPYRDGCLLRFLKKGISACYGICFPGAEKAGFLRDVHWTFALGIALLDEPEKLEETDSEYARLLKEYEHLLMVSRALLENCGEECLRRSTSECRECELTKDVERASRFLESLKPRE